MKNKLWRPEGWKPPQIVPYLQFSKALSPDDIALYEAGADAMLEALRNRDNAITPFAKDSWRQYLTPECGTVVFIPDDPPVAPDIAGW